MGSNLLWDDIPFELILELDLNNKECFFSLEAPEPPFRSIGDPPLKILPPHLSRDPSSCWMI